LPRHPQAWGLLRLRFALKALQTGPRLDEHSVHHEMVVTHVILQTHVLDDGVKKTDWLRRGAANGPDFC
jgi:hypothetical protein